MGSVLQLPVGKPRTAALQRIRAANESTGQTSPDTAAERPAVRIASCMYGAANVGRSALRLISNLAISTVRSVASLVVGMLAILLSWIHRPAYVLLSLAGIALVAGLFMCASKGWPDHSFAMKLAIGLVIDLALLVLMTRFLQSLFRLEHRLKGRL